MVYLHCPRTRPGPRQIARPIKMAYIDLCEGVHTAPRISDAIGLAISSVSLLVSVSDSVKKPLVSVV